MIDAMHIFQNVMKQESSNVNKFGNVHDDPEVAHTVNYILLPVEHYGFMLHQLDIHITKINVPAYARRNSAYARRNSAYVWMNHDSRIYSLVIRNGNKEIIISHDCNLSTFISDATHMHHRMTLFSLIFDNFSHQSVNKACAKYFLSDKSIALKLLDQDFSCGYTEFIRQYVMHYKNSISEIIRICSENQWNELSMTIMRICEEENLRTESQIRL